MMTNAEMARLHHRRFPGSEADVPGSATSMFELARERARRARFWSAITGGSRALLALTDVRDRCTIVDRRDGGNRTVRLSEIRGSHGRSRYFDREFNPLYDGARGRWMNIARARQQGKQLPPVVLVQVGDVYFVLDGHHRISVARALGQGDIEARVTEWQVAGSLPWQMPARAPDSGRLLRRLQRALFGVPARHAEAGAR